MTQAGGILAFGTHIQMNMRSHEVLQPRWSQEFFRSWGDYPTKDRQQSFHVEKDAMSIRSRRVEIVLDFQTFLVEECDRDFVGRQLPQFIPNDITLVVRGPKRSDEIPVIFKPHESSQVENDV